MTLEVDQRRPTRRNPTVDPVPYTGVQFVAIPEFAGIAHRRWARSSRPRSPASRRAEEALAKAQALTTDEMEAAGY